MTSRFHIFEGVENVRDYGDYATAASRQLKSGRLFRSAHWANATDADLDRFAALGVATIVDLRRAIERQRQPSRRHAACAAAVITASPRPDDLTEAPHIRVLKQGDLTLQRGRDYMKSTYRRIPYEEAHTEIFRQYFQTLAESDAPVLIHCAAGKDRTGILAALTHRIAGVHQDDLLEDYLLTNTAMRLEERAPDLAQQLARWTGKPPPRDAVIAFMGVEEAYLAEAFAEIDRQSGSLDAYFENALGLDARTRGRIAERLCA